MHGLVANKRENVGNYISYIEAFNVLDIFRDVLNVFAWLSKNGYCLGWTMPVITASYFVLLFLHYDCGTCLAKVNMHKYSTFFVFNIYILLPKVEFQRHTYNTWKQVGNFTLINLIIKFFFSHSFYFFACFKSNCGNENQVLYYSNIFAPLKVWYLMCCYFIRFRIDWKKGKKMSNKHQNTSTFLRE